MMNDFPKSFDICRQGKQRTVSVANLEQLIELRTELELVRRFGAGATTELIGVLDRRIARLWTQDQTDSPGDAEWIEQLEDMRAILCDSLAPVNRRAIARIDEECPQAQAGVTMDSINKDSKEFRQDVVKQLEAESNEDVDALLAAFEEATREPNVDALSAADGSSSSPVEADLETLLADAAGGDLNDSSLDALVASIEALDDSAPAARAAEDTAGGTEPSFVDAEPAEPGQADFVESPGTKEARAYSIEEVTEQMTERLTTAEEQLGSIASAFEAAAAELGQVNDETLQPSATTSFAAPADADLTMSPDAPHRTQFSTSAAKPAAAVTYPNVDTKPDTSGATDSGSFGKQATGCASLRPAGQLRSQIKHARANILSELDDLLVLLERVDQMQGQAESSLHQARQFEQAAARALQAGQTLAAAEADAAQARAQFEQAQSRVTGARLTWEQAQQEAATAAAAASA